MDIDAQKVGTSVIPSGLDAQEIVRLSQGACHALTVQEQYGVWGGLAEDERLSLLQKTRHGREPSTPAARNHESMCVTGSE